MKELFTGLACTIIFVISIMYQSSFNKFIREYEHLKYVVDEAAASANLCLEDLDVTDGRRIFNQDECQKAIEYMIEDGLKFDNGLKPLKNSYWKEPITYKAYYFDESTVSLPYLFEETKTGYVKLVTEPTVIVTIDAGKPPVLFTQDADFRAIRSSAYDGLEE